LAVLFAKVGILAAPYAAMPHILNEPLIRIVYLAVRKSRQVMALVAPAPVRQKFRNQPGKMQNDSDFRFITRTPLTILPDFLTISSSNPDCLANDILAQSPRNPYMSPQIIRHYSQARATVAAA